MLKILNYNTKTFPEGCGSVCGYTGDVKRFEEVQLSGFNEKGDAIEMHLRNWNARIAQHEVIFLYSFFLNHKTELKLIIVFFLVF